MSAARITGLDVTRGFAVMGILTMNIISFAMPENAYLDPLAWGPDTLMNRLLWAINFLLFDSKMRGLFTLLFGASTLLIIERAQASGQSAARVHFARMATLALFGLLHGFLIWSGDILFSYAVAGLLLYRWRDADIRSLCVWAALALLSLALIGAPLLSIGLSHDPTSVRAYADLAREFAPTAPGTLQEVALYRGGYAGIFHQRVVEEGLNSILNAVAFLPETLAQMLIGMVLLRAGMLRGEWPLERLARWRNRAMALGLLGNGVLLAWQWRGGFDVWAVVTSSLVWSVPFDMMMAVGWAAAFMGLAQQSGARGLLLRVAATGRAAFTNYLGTSLVMTSIFYGYGLGLFGQIGRLPLWLFVTAAWLVMLGWSKPWLARYRYGPLEWLWRSLARGQWQPMRGAG